MTDVVAIVPSASESARFGRRVARAVLESAEDVEALRAVLEHDEHDLVIVRFPADVVAAGELLASVPGRAAIYADTLLYFRWQDSDTALHVGRQVVLRDGIDGAAVAPAVQRIFAGYVNHYAANSALDAALVADGYAEWATGLAADPSNVLVGVIADGALAGLAVIDASDEWNVVLAGVDPAHRGAGVYGDLMTAVMQHARAEGEHAVRISTQSHNIQVMRTWERLGWRIVSSTVTMHLERVA